MEAIIASVITGFIAALSSIYASRVANDKTVAVLNERIKNVKEDIKRLEEKQDEANNIKVRLAVAEHDIYNLKQGKVSNNE